MTKTELIKSLDGIRENLEDEKHVTASRKLLALINKTNGTTKSRLQGFDMLAIKNVAKAIDAFIIDLEDEMK